MMTQSKKPGSTSGRRKSGKSKSRTPSREDIVSAMLELAAGTGWKDLDLQAIAAAANCSMSDLHALFPSKTAILRAAFLKIDAAVLADVDADPFDGDESARDRLFDVLMRRFDALAPHKDAVRGMADSVRRSPLAAAETARATLPGLGQSMCWMLEIAGISAGGWRGAVRAKALTAVYLSTLRTWLSDDSADMAKTMAALDSNLRRAEPLIV